MPVTLLNVFIVPEHKEEEFLQHWRRTTETFRKKKGFIETHLHRNTGVGNQTFQFINIAKGESGEAGRSTHDDYKPTEYTFEGVRGHPAIFESIVNIHYDGDEPQPKMDWSW